MSNDSAIKAFEARVKDAIDQAVNLRVDRIKKIALKAADAEADRLFKVIAADYVNKSSTPPPFVTQGAVWEMLDPTYAMRKGHSRFFYYSGELRQELSAMSGVNTYGKSTATVATTGKRGGKRLSIVPFSYLSGLNDSSVLDAFTGVTARKLRGRAGHYRPLIDPAIAHFMHYRVPRAVSRALRDAGYKVGSAKS